MSIKCRKYLPLDINRDYMYAYVISKSTVLILQLKIQP